MHLALLMYGDPGAGPELGPPAAAVLRDIRDRLDGLYPEFPGIESFLDRPDRHPRPAILVDSGDVVSAGGWGDSTVILRAMLDRNIAFRTALPLVSPAAVARARELGEGGEGEFILGDPASRGYNRPVCVRGRVARVDRRPVTLRGPSMSGVSVDLGDRALVEMAPAIALVLSEHAALTHDPEILRSLGLDPAACDWIVQKTHKLFRPAYRPIARSVTVLDTPGWTDRNLRRLPFLRLRRPIYPLDDMPKPEWEVRSWLQER